MSDHNGTQSLQSKNRPPFLLAIFASGAGSNAQKIIDHFKTSSLAKIALIVSNRKGAGVLKIGEAEKIPSLIINRDQFFHGDSYMGLFEAKKIDFIVLAGFLWKVPDALVARYRRRIVNIHPALLPNFGGKGMYGQFVHEAVIESSQSESGITIHFVDEHYDNGDIILQAKCPVLPGDTPELLAQRIHALEHANYPVVIEEILKKIARESES